MCRILNGVFPCGIYAQVGKIGNRTRERSERVK